MQVYYAKIAILGQYLVSPRVVDDATAKCCTHSCAERGKLMTLIADKQRRLLFARGGRRRVYDKKPQRYAEDKRT